MTTVLGAVPGAGKNSWTGSNDPTNMTEMDPQIRGAVVFLTRQRQIEVALRQHLPEALRLLAAHKRSQQQAGYGLSGELAELKNTLTKLKNAYEHMLAPGANPSRPGYGAEAGMITRRELEWRGSEPWLFGPAVRRGW